MKKQSNYPLYEVTPFSNIKEMLYIAEKEAGSDIAFKYKDKSNNVIEVTYKQFRADTHSLGSALTALGLNNLHVACIGNNSYPWVTAYLTMLGSAGVFVPIDKELPSEDIINVINHSDSEAMFYSGEYEKIYSIILTCFPKSKYLSDLIVWRIVRTEDSYHIKSCLSMDTP